MAKRRKSGFQWPWSYQQVLSWILFLSEKIVFIVLILPTYNLGQMIAVSSAIFSSFGLLAAFLILLTCSDPSDKLVEAYLNSQDDNYKHHLEVCSTRVCNYCEAPVNSIDTKHCLSCNRCTQNFDHHCKYVNNCVGGKNYRLFFCLVVSVEVNEFIMIAVYIMYFANKQSEINAYTTFVVVGFVKSLCFLAFSTYLLVFHLYLIRNRLTTYDFIMRKRKEKKCVSPEKNLSDTNLQS